MTAFFRMLFTGVLAFPLFLVGCGSEPESRVEPEDLPAYANNSDAAAYGYTQSDPYAESGGQSSDGQTQPAAQPNDGGDGYDQPDPYAQANAGGNTGYDQPDPYAQANASGGNDDNQDPYAQGQTYGAPDEGVTPPANRPGYGGNDDGTGGDPDPYAAQNQQGYGNQDAYGYGASGSGAGVGVSFVDDIEPILNANCYSCHGSEGRPKGDLQLHTADAITSAGVVQGGSPTRSELFARITMRRDEEGTMPPKGPGLNPDEIEKIRAWIQAGADFGDGGGYGPGNGGGYGPDDDYGPGGGRPQAPPPPKTLAEFASRAISVGKDRDAMKFLYAQALENSDDGSNLLKKYRWSPALKRPVLAVRWGIGVKYRETSKITGGPRPIGVDQDIPGSDRGGRSSGGGGYGGSGGFGSGSSTFDSSEAEGSVFHNAALDYYTGALGSRLIERLRMRMEIGHYGELLKEQLDLAMAASNPDDFDNESFGGGYGSSDGYGVPPRGGGGRFGAPGGDRDDDDEPENRIEQVMPGVTMLGTDTLPTLYEKAHEQQVDLMVVFEVTVSKDIARRLYVNRTRLRMYDVATETQVANTNSLDNVEIQRTKEKDPDDDTIDLELDKLFLDVADKEYACVDLPTGIKAAHVVNRVKTLMAAAEEESNPLWMLAEVRFYRSRDLLTDKQLAGVMGRMIPKEQAKSLFSAKDSDTVKELMKDWLPSPESLVVREGDDDEEGTNPTEFR